VNEFINADETKQEEVIRGSNDVPNRRPFAPPSKKALKAARPMSERFAAAMGAAARDAVPVNEDDARRARNRRRRGKVAAK
jgi:hypothetical protein